MKQTLEVKFDLLLKESMSEAILPLRVTVWLWKLEIEVDKWEFLDSNIFISSL
jgi:hypothetical protein